MSTIPSYCKLHFVCFLTCGWTPALILFLTILSKAAVSIGVKCLLESLPSTALGVKLGVELLVHVLILCLAIRGAPKPLPSSRPISHSCRQCMKVPCLHFSPVFVTNHFFSDSHPVDMNSMPSQRVDVGFALLYLINLKAKMVKDKHKENIFDIGSDKISH